MIPIYSLVFVTEYKNSGKKKKYLGNIKYVFYLSYQMRQNRIELRRRDRQRARKMISNLEGPHQSVSHAGGYCQMTYGLPHRNTGNQSHHWDVASD